MSAPAAGSASPLVAGQVRAGLVLAALPEDWDTGEAVTALMVAAATIAGARGAADREALAAFFGELLAWSAEDGGARCD